MISRVRAVLGEVFQSLFFWIPLFRPDKNRGAPATKEVSILVFLDTSVPGCPAHFPPDYTLLSKFFGSYFAPLAPKKSPFQPDFSERHKGHPFEMFAISSFKTAIADISVAAVPARGF